MVRAWIWQPQHEGAYVAERGAGAFRNGERPRDVAAPTPRLAAGDLATALGGARLAGLRAFELTWVCCGVDYPQLVRAGPTSSSRPAAPVGPRAGRLMLTEAGGYLGTVDGGDYLPQGPEHPGLIGAATGRRTTSRWD